MDTRLKIIAAAAELFRTYGIRAVTMDMLATNMGISKRTIYEKFNDKDELLVGVLKWMSEKQKEMNVRVFKESENVIAGVFRLFILMNEHFRAMSPAFKLDMEKYHNDIINKLKETGEMPYSNDNAEMLKRGIKEGLFRRDIDISISNKCLLEMLRMSADNNTFNTENLSKAVVFRDFYINYLRGISTPRGLELINYYEAKLNKNKKQNSSLS